MFNLVLLITMFATIIHIISAHGGLSVDDVAFFKTVEEAEMHVTKMIYETLKENYCERVMHDIEPSKEDMVELIKAFYDDVESGHDDEVSFLVITADVIDTVLKERVLKYEIDNGESAECTIANVGHAFEYDEDIVGRYFV